MGVIMGSTLAMPVFDKPVKLLIVAAAGALTDAATAAAKEFGAVVEIQLVPDQMYIPPTIAMAARLAEFDGFAVVQLKLDPELRRDLGLLGLQGLCIGLGYSGGPDAVIGALHLIAISRKWAGQTKGIGFRA